MEQMTLQFEENISGIDLLKSTIAQQLKGSLLSDAICAVENKGYMAVKAKSLIAVKITQRKSDVLLEYKSKYDTHFKNYNIQHTTDKMSRIELPNMDAVVSLSKEFCKIAAEVLTESGATFGCCGRYEQCSDAKRCIHPDALYSLTCSYRKNLEAGRIFYGKNRI